MTIQAIAQDLYAAFATSTRVNGDTFYRLKTGSPRWMKVAVKAAHDNGNIRPDDWRFQAIHDVAELLAECSDPDDIDLESLVDVYDSELLAWLESSTWRMSYCDDALTEAICNQWGLSMSGAMMRGQLYEYREILDQLLHALSLVDEVTC